VRILRRRVQGTSEEGFAMIIVIGTAMVLTLVVAVVLAYATLSVLRSRHEQDYLAAIAAAQAGVDDYLSRLNADNTYWQTTDCTNIAERHPVTSGSAPCGWSGSTSVGWSPIAGTTSPSGQSCAATPTPVGCGLFHYDVDTSHTLSDGTIWLTSSGRSKQVNRSVKVAVREEGFTDFLYYSDIESVDPSNRYVYGVNNGNAQAKCSHHFWDNSPRDTSYCSDIYWTDNDVINGPLHTNDALLITDSPTFNGPASTSYPACAPNGHGQKPPQASCYRNGGSAHPVFSKGLSYASEVQLPPTNSALRAQTDPATSTGAPGCLFTGPTRIRFNTGGTMTVWSPYTLSNTSGCGGAQPSNATITVPDNNVIYVQNVPSGQRTPRSGDCAPGAIGGYPQSGDVNYDYGEYDCRAGTLFVSGQLSGRVTAGADNNIIVVDDLTYAGGATGADSLGLVANNSVEVYHPVRCTRWQGQTCTTGTNMNLPGQSSAFTNPVIDAAILSLAHSVAVQVYPLGNPLGTLNVFGAMSQKYRGAVGTFSQQTGDASAGYYKNYSYDTRLKYAPPPFYLDPVETAYGVTTFAEVRAVY
jgi:hypothetical protein